MVLKHFSKSTLLDIGSFIGGKICLYKPYFHQWRVKHSDLMFQDVLAQQASKYL